MTSSAPGRISLPQEIIDLIIEETWASIPPPSDSDKVKERLPMPLDPNDFEEDSDEIEGESDESEEESDELEEESYKLAATSDKLEATSNKLEKLESEDERTLRTFLLVSRSFRKSALPHIFRNLRLAIKDNQPTDRLRSLVDILESASSAKTTLDDPGRHIRNVSLTFQPISYTRPRDHVYIPKDVLCQNSVINLLVATLTFLMNLMFILDKDLPSPGNTWASPSKKPSRISFGSNLSDH